MNSVVAEKDGLESTDPQKGRFTVVKLIIGGALLAGLLVTISSLPLQDWIEGFIAWVEQWGTLGYVLYGLLYAVLVVFMVPASLLTLGAGFTYGLGKGFVIVSLASTLGAAGRCMTIMRHR